jgi:hypothetical protein
MDIQINGEPAEIEIDSGMTFKNCLDRLEKDVVPQNHTIYLAKLDGTQIDLGDNDYLSGSISEAGKLLEVQTMTPEDLAYTTLFEIMKHLPGLIDALKLISEKIQSQQNKEALTVFQQLLTAWFWINDGIVKSSKILSIDLAAEGEGEGKHSLQTLQVELVRLLQDANTSMQQEDWVGLSDVLEYELAPLILKQAEGIVSILENAPDEMKRNNN